VSQVSLAATRLPNPLNSQMAPGPVQHPKSLRRAGQDCSSGRATPPTAEALGSIPAWCRESVILPGAARDLSFALSVTPRSGTLRSGGSVKGPVPLAGSVCSPGLSVRLGTPEGKGSEGTKWKLSGHRDKAVGGPG
jgi:hypothetical protein